MTFDEQTRHYTNLTEDFSLFGNRKIQLCGKDFIGYVQDVSEDEERILNLRDFLRIDLDYIDGR